MLNHVDMCWGGGGGGWGLYKFKWWYLKFFQKKLSLTFPLPLAVVFQTVKP